MFIRLFDHSIQLFFQSAGSGLGGPLGHHSCSCQRCTRKSSSTAAGVNGAVTITEQEIFRADMTLTFEDIVLRFPFYLYACRISSRSLHQHLAHIQGGACRATCCLTLRRQTGPRHAGPILLQRFIDQLHYMFLDFGEESMRCSTSSG